ncbi:MAG: chemotaxis protein CheA [Deferribacteres bacterium]|nr:chemotaxis protein CheA [Deferribacteres bacterium]
MPDEMEEIISEFITEAEESLDRIEPLFVELEQKGHDADMLNDIFRSMHTIKGAAGFLGFQSIVDVAHSSENIMKKLRDGEITLSKRLMDVILKAIDMLRLLLEHLREKDGIEEDVAPLTQELENVLKESLSGSPDGGVTVETREKEKDETSRPQDDNAVSNGEPAPSHGDETQRHGEEDNAEKPGEPAQVHKDTSHKAKEAAQNLRVDVERIDKVMDLAGEMVLIRNRLLNISHYFDLNYSSDTQTETLMEAVSFLDRVTSDMQLAVMKIRMQPIQKVFSKFPRLVRDISASVNKKVEIEIYGEGTEVDKSVIEHIGDPMTHILRNSIDHGIESPEERIAKGKPEKGKIVVNTYQKGNQIVIEITDDGKGIDIEKLKEKAVEKGMLTEEEASKMSDEAAVNIIFMPGFSTKETATELSGRGVGMDVVNNNISLLNGYVEVSTQKDKGSTFRICIPLTLAIIQALMVEVAGIKYAIPLSPIEETLKISKDEVDNITGQDVIVIRNKVCPLFELNGILGTGSNGGHDRDHKYVVVISLGEKKFCLAVDKLLGQEEVVIKTLEGIDTASSYVLGASITGDGKIVFILDVTAMSRSLVEAT